MTPVHRISGPPASSSPFLPQASCPGLHVSALDARLKDLGKKTRESSSEGQDFTLWGKKPAVGLLFLSPVWRFSLTFALRGAETALLWGGTR